MKARTRKKPRVALGKAFLKLAAAFEDANAAKTDKLLRKMGKKAPACYREIGTVCHFSPGWHRAGGFVAVTITSLNTCAGERRRLVKRASD
jgi:hypothetical protein